MNWVSKKLCKKHKFKKNNEHFALNGPNIRNEIKNPLIKEEKSRLITHNIDFKIKHNMMGAVVIQDNVFPIQRNNFKGNQNNF